MNINREEQLNSISWENMQNLSFTERKRLPVRMKTDFLANLTFHLNKATCFFKFLTSTKKETVLFYIQNFTFVFFYLDTFIIIPETKKLKIIFE